MSSYVWPNEDGWPYPDQEGELIDFDNELDDDVVSLRAAPSTIFDMPEESALGKASANPPRPMSASSSPAVLSRPSGGRPLARMPNSTFSLTARMKDVSDGGS